MAMSMSSNSPKPACAGTPSSRHRPTVRLPITPSTQFAAADPSRKGTADAPEQPDAGCSFFATLPLPCIAVLFQCRTVGFVDRGLGWDDACSRTARHSFCPDVFCNDGFAVVVGDHKH